MRPFLLWYAMLYSILEEKLTNSEWSCYVQKNKIGQAN